MLMHTHEARLDALRKQLAQDGLDGFVIPISDEHMSEYVGAYAQRLADKRHADTWPRLTVIPPALSRPPCRP